MNDEPDANSAARGIVTRVRGSVVDARFGQDLQAVHSKLMAGEDGDVVLEVVTHLDDTNVRTIALTSTRGLFRGADAVDTGGPLDVPVGRELLGRMLDVFGTPTDGRGDLGGVQRRSIHARPVPLAQQATTSDVFETGIEAVDVLAPMELGGKAGLFGGAGVGKTVFIAELIHNVAGGP